MSKLQKLRSLSFNRQNGLCYYCSQPMWQNDSAAFARRYGLSDRGAWRHRVTAEHLIARSNAGRDEEANVVAACAYCNMGRHRTAKALNPEEHERKVRKRLIAGRWHGLQVAS